MQDKLEYADGTPWNEVHNILDTKANIIWLLMWDADLSQEEFQEYYKEVERELREEEIDSFSVFYVSGARRHMSYEVILHDSLEDAMDYCHYGTEDGYISANFIIDPQKKRIYPSPYKNLDWHISI
jgi:hypothetical protein